MSPGQSPDARGCPPPGGDGVYALGTLGAWVFYWRRAQTGRQRVAAVLKGVVWPAFLVYEAFSALEGRGSEDVPVDPAAQI